MKYFYDLIFLLFSIIYLPYLAIKGKAHRDFVQRFGILPKHLKDDRYHTLWIHAVSVGEVMASETLIKKMKEAFPDFRIVLSVTTKTGYDMAERIFKESAPRFYFPLDFHFVAEKTIDFINPFIFVLFETEIWPNLILTLSDRKIPIILVNGRISDKSFKSYKIIAPLFKSILEKVAKFLMQTEEDAKRIVSIGAPSERVKVCGNVKYDVRTSPSGRLLFAPLAYGVQRTAPEWTKEKLGIDEKEDIIICGSTHKGEEDILLEAYKELLKNFNNLHLLIAPRHIDRVGEIENLCTKFGFEAVRLSRINAVRNTPYAVRIIILDTLGHLAELYSLATIVFMGGSLVRRGGHNLVEPARFAKPIIFGHYMHNFRDMASQFLEARASIKIKDSSELKESIKNLLMDTKRREQMGENALALVEKNRGAVSRIVEEIKTLVTV